MKRKLQILTGLAVAILLTTLSSFYTVSEVEQIVITRFGKPIGESITKSGLHFKIPFIDKVIRFEERILESDGDPNQVNTKDKKFIWIDTTSRWQIVDALKFLQTVKDYEGAHTRLDDIIDGSFRNEITSQDLIELVRNSDRVIDKLKEEREQAGDNEEVIISKISIGRETITRNVLKKATPDIEKFGIKLIDVRIKGLNYENSVQKSVFDRMISERKKIATKLRSEGEAESAKINGKLKLDLDTIDSEAYRTAQEIKGEADGEAARIYAEAFDTDPDFYNFLASLEAYEKALQKNGTLILGSETEFLKVLKNAGK